LGGFRIFLGMLAAFFLLPALFMAVAYFTDTVLGIDTPAVRRLFIAGYLGVANLNTPALLVISLVWAIGEIVNGVMKLTRYMRRPKI
jgi:hypothetical protein